MLNLLIKKWLLSCELSFKAFIIFTPSTSSIETSNHKTSWSLRSMISAKSKWLILVSVPNWIFSIPKQQPVNVALCSSWLHKFLITYHIQNQWISGHALSSCSFSLRELILSISLKWQLNNIRLKLKLLYFKHSLISKQKYI